MFEKYGTVEQALDAIIAPSLTPRKNIGLAVGVIKDGHHQIFGYGTLNNTRTDPINGSTLFEIGSVTKIFTSALLVSAIQDGLVEIDDSLCDLLPELSNLPRDITLRRLATHTSGLPRLPPNLTHSVLSNPQNPYEAYTNADLLGYLATYTPTPERTAPSVHAFHYSNLGFGLLGHVLAQKMGTSYEASVGTRICDPLGLGDTRVNLSPEQRERLAGPHTARGKPTLNWELPTLAGQGRSVPRRAIC